MLVISGSRGSGKTSALIGAFLKDPKGVLVFPEKIMLNSAVCSNPDLVPFLLAKRVVTARYVEMVCDGWQYRNLYVDEAHMCDLSYYVRSMVVAVTGP